MRDVSPRHQHRCRQLSSCNLRRTSCLSFLHLRRSSHQANVQCTWSERLGTMSSRRSPPAVKVDGPWQSMGSPSAVPVFSGGGHRPVCRCSPDLAPTGFTVTPLQLGPWESGGKLTLESLYHHDPQGGQGLGRAQVHPSMFLDLSSMAWHNPTLCLYIR